MDIRELEASLDILVADADQSFARSVADGLESTHDSVTADRIDGNQGVVERIRSEELDGVVVGTEFETPGETIEELASCVEVPTIVLADPGDEDPIARALRAGATDVFPRTTAAGQCELVVERIASAREGTVGATTTGSEAPDVVESVGAGYREVFENVADGLVIHDPETGEIVDVNDRFCDMNGYDRRELVGEDVGIVTAPGEEYSYEAARAEIRTARDEGPRLFEWRNQHRNGETFPVEVHLAVIELEGRERVLASVRDVSERVERERELEERRQLYSTLVEQSPNGVMIVQEKSIQFVNPQLTSISGWSEADLVGRPFQEIVTAEYRDLVERRYERRSSGESPPNNYEIAIRTADGGERVVDLHVSSIEYRGEPATLATFNDVTELRRRERVVRRLHESTGDLQDAETPEEVCRAVVDAAEEVLELTMPTTWLVGVDEPGVLTPVAATDLAWDLPNDGPGTFEPGDFEHEVYRGGEMEVYDPSERFEETPLENALLVPLGGHGLIGAAEPGLDSFDEVTLDAARILARQATVALDRVERGRELRESERRFRLIAEHIDEVIYLASADFSEIEYINPAFEEIYGQSIEKLSEDPTAFVEAAHPDDRDRYVRDVQELIADVRAGQPDEIYEGQYRLERDGEIRWVTVARFPVENDAGTVDRIVGRVRDVTERKRREREYERIFNGVQDAILLIDPDTLEIIDANDAFLELAGYDDFETIRDVGVEGLSQEEFTFEEGRRIHQRVAETGDPELVEWEAETADGERRWLEVKVAPAVINGEEVTVAINRDVTERRQLERRFRTIADRVEEVIYLTNADLTEVHYVNEAFVDVFGRPVEELHDNPRAFLDAVHPGDREPFEADLQAMLSDIESGDPDERYEFAYRIERPDGEIRWLEQTGYPILTEPGTPHRFVGVTKDVTERYRRERTLETFQEATRELTAAESRSEACQQAVRAAEDVLGFPLVSTYLYDEDTGRLRPTAVTDRLEELEVDLRPFGPGDSLPWQVYVEGESTTSAEMAPDVYGPGVSPPDIVLPLGSHGVMLVGAPREEFDAEDLELAQILAATLEAALNHVAGERALEAREEELRRQQERADRFQQLNTIIRDIERATVDRSSRRGIEEAVCERLVDVDLHDLVWVAEPSVSGDELVPRTGAGGKDEYLDALSTGLGSEGAGHPAAAASRSEDPRVVDNVATEVSGGTWRKRALRHGVQSVVAVPIRHETTLHGVLTVESGEPDAFDEATEEVLAELGRSIGHAITVTEREQALESEGTTELEFSIGDEGLFPVRAANEAACSVSLERTVRRSGGSFSTFYVVEDNDPAAVFEVAEATPSVESARTISVDEEDGGGLVEVTAPTWFGSPLTEKGAVVRETTAAPDGGTLLVEAPRGTDVRTLVEAFQERYPETELVAQRQRERPIRSLFELQDALRDELTDRQWEALETAYSAGYFEWPREINGEGAADLLGVSQPTFNKHLRIAERTAFRMLLDREYPDESGS